jgi:hypothetical protein
MMVIVEQVVEWRFAGETNTRRKLTGIALPFYYMNVHAGSLYPVGKITQNPLDGILCGEFASAGNRTPILGQ